MGDIGKQISVSFRLTWSIQQPFDKSRLCNETLSQRGLRTNFLYKSDVILLFSAFVCLWYMYIWICMFICSRLTLIIFLNYSTMFIEAGSLSWAMHALILLVWLSSMLCKFPGSSSCQLVLQMDCHAYLAFTSSLGILTLISTLEPQLCLTH